SRPRFVRRCAFTDGIRIADRHVTDPVLDLVVRGHGDSAENEQDKAEGSHQFNPIAIPIKMARRRAKTGQISSLRMPKLDTFAFDSMPRCSRYHSQSLSGLSDLKKIPPMLVTRFILRQHLRDGGLAMNFCCVEERNPFVICIA